MKSQTALDRSDEPLTAKARGWRSPTVRSIAMDAEIGSYQEDRDPPREPGHESPYFSRS